MGTWAALRQRIGHRGAFLLFLAILDAAVGYSFLTLTVAAAGAVHLIFPAPWWAAAWLTVGAACAVSAFRRRDTPAFMAAAALKGTWCAATAWAWLAYHIPQGWLGVIFWAAFAVTVLLVSSWPEPPATARMPGARS